jgi:protein-tyrosine phosphatase
MLVNFRTLKKYSKSRAKIRENFFYRSGELVGLTEEDKKYLFETLGIKQVIDFRSDVEMQERQDELVPGVRYLQIDLLKTSKHNASLSDASKVAEDPKQVMK